MCPIVPSAWLFLAEPGLLHPVESAPPCIQAAMGFKLARLQVKQACIIINYSGRDKK